jgi:hypothetical protein
VVLSVEVCVGRALGPPLIETSWGVAIERTCGNGLWGTWGSSHVRVMLLRGIFGLGSLGPWPPLWSDTDFGLVVSSEAGVWGPLLALGHPGDRDRLEGGPVE